MNRDQLESKIIEDEAKVVGYFEFFVKSINSRKLSEISRANHIGTLKYKIAFANANLLHSFELRAAIDRESSYIHLAIDDRHTPPSKDIPRNMRRCTWLWPMTQVQLRRAVGDV